VNPLAIFRRFTCGLRSELDGALYDLVFRLTGPTREFFNRAAIRSRVSKSILGRPRMDPAKQPLHAAELFEDPSPIQQGELS